MSETKKNTKNMKKKTRREMNNPREAALLVLHQVAKEGAYANLALNACLRRFVLNPLDKSLVTELVYGTLRRQGTLDYWLDSFLSRPLSKLPLWILLILRLGLYQLRYMDKIPPAAAINESVCLAKKYGHQGTAGLVNGVLRNVLRHPEKLIFPDAEEFPAQFISVCYSHPLWLVRRWLEEYGFDDTVALCEFDNRSAEFSLRVNTLKNNRETVLRRLETAGVDARAGRYTPETVLVGPTHNDTVQALLAEGRVYSQHQSSMLAAWALRPQPGSRVIDACAAPGGKTTHLAQLMENRGEIRAFDLFDHKVKLIQENCARLGIDIVRAARCDSRCLPEELDDWADYVLVDAPCSGLGVLRIRPDARWQKTEEQIPQLAALTGEILNCAARKVRVGGKILFSTCTVTKEENQDAVARFLREHQNFEAVAITGMPKMIFADTACWQILPQKHGLDGFFLAKFRRKS